LLTPAVLPEHTRMARPRNPVPTYKKHPTKDEARCWLNGQWVSLGRWNSPDSLAEYNRICAECRAAAVAGQVARTDRRETTISEVLLAFTRHVHAHYRRHDGTASSEVKEYQAALRHVRELYGHTPAADVGPLALQAVRRRMIDAGWCRTRVNKQVGRVRRMFKWAVSQELVGESQYQALRSVDGLQKHRTDAPERARVEPVADAHVDATL